MGQPWIDHEGRPGIKDCDECDSVSMRPSRAQKETIHGRREGVESSSFKRLGSEGEKKTREQPEGQVRSPGGFVYVCF